MKAIYILAVLLPAAALADSGSRLCPDGYTYLGDDLAPPPNSKSWVYEEVDRTQVYSCYKLMYDDKSNWLDSTHKCWDEEAQLVSLEVSDEMPRVAGLRKNSGALNILTSAMRFSDGWYWVGTNQPVDPSIPLFDKQPSDNPAHPESKYPYDCLALSVSDTKEDAIPEYSLTAVPCSIETPDYNSYMCEVRVQTVTYRTWFQANWLDFTLTALIIILFVALCVTLCCYPTTSSRAYSTRQQRPATRATRARPNADQVLTNKPPAYDYPPAYDNAVRVHQAQSGQQKTEAVPLSMLNRMKTRGGELVAKVYYYRTPAAGNNNSNSSA